MKITNVLLTFIVCTLSICSYANNTADVKLFKDLKKESLKCHVESINKKTYITRMYNLPVKDKAKFVSSLLQKGITEGNKHISVTKVYECININRNFFDLDANKLDKDQQLNG